MSSVTKDLFVDRRDDANLLLCKRDGEGDGAS